MTRIFRMLPIVVCDIENLKRNLLLFTQIKDLGIPTILAINMADRMERKAISLNIEEMEVKLETKIALISSRKNEGFDNLKELITNYASTLPQHSVWMRPVIAPDYFDRLKKSFSQSGSI